MIPPIVSASDEKLAKSGFRSHVGPNRCICSLRFMQDTEFSTVEHLALHALGDCDAVTVVDAHGNRELAIPSTFIGMKLFWENLATWAKTCNAEEDDGASS